MLGAEQHRGGRDSVMAEMEAELPIEVERLKMSGG